MFSPSVGIEERTIGIILDDRIEEIFPYLACRFYRGLKVHETELFLAEQFSDLDAPPVTQGGSTFLSRMGRGGEYVGHRLLRDGWMTG